MIDRSFFWFTCVRKSRSIWKYCYRKSNNRYSSVGSLDEELERRRRRFTCHHHFHHHYHFHHHHHHSHHYHHHFHHHHHHFNHYFHLHSGQPVRLRQHHPLPRPRQLKGEIIQMETWGQRALQSWMMALIQNIQSPSSSSPIWDQNHHRQALLRSESPTRGAGLFRSGRSSSFAGFPRSQCDDHMRMKDDYYSSSSIAQ